MNKPADIAFETLQQELLAFYRGSHTRSQMNSQLKLSHNLYHRWESAQHKIPWSQFLRVTEHAGHDVGKGLATIFFYKEDPQDYAQLLRNLIGDQELKEVSQALQVSNLSIQRWLKKKTEMSATDLFRLMHYKTDRFVDFIAEISDITELPSVFPLFEKIEQERNLYFSKPLWALVPRCLELQEYEDLPTHRNGFIAEKLGFSLEEERKALETFLHMQILEWKNSKIRVVKKYLNNNDVKNPWRLHELFSFWAERHWQRSLLETQLRKQNQKSQYRAGAYRVFAANEKTFAQLKKCIMNFDREVTAILSSPENDGDNKLVMSMITSVYDLPEEELLKKS